MAEKIVEGLWDCPYCNADKIGGLTKYCPNCGNPQSKDTKFYMGTKKEYLTEEEIAAVGTEADWKCEYCFSLNNAKLKVCKGCGAERTEENKDYHQIQKEKEAKEAAKVTAAAKTKARVKNASVPKKNKKKKKSIIPILIVIALVLGLIALFMPYEYTAVISEKSWERNVVIEEYKTVEESCWDMIPEGGRLVDKKREIRTYQTVLSHYETKTREVAEQVLDGYDIEVYYVDNGNGTFTEKTREIPRYRTEYRTETYEDPVYIAVPVYDTKYYYEIERWMYDRTEESSGVNDEPYWPAYTLEDNEQVDTQEGTYYIEVYVEEDEKAYEYTCLDFEEFNRYKLGDEVEVEVIADVVTEILNE